MTQILAPSGLLGVADKVRPSNVVVMSEFAATQSGEIGFRAIGAGAVDAIAVLVVDPLHSEAGVQRALTLLRDEVDRDMALLGIRSISEISPDLVRRL